MLRSKTLVTILVGLLIASACSSDDSKDESSEESTRTDASALTDDTGSDKTVLTGPGGPMELLALHAEPDPNNGGRIVDEMGRDVLLRGVNLNAFGEYWSGNEFPTVFPFTEADAVRMSEIGWNSVRLLFSWSLIEPEPGLYDEEYIEELASAVELLAKHGIYTILDSHQDAWGATLAARPDEVCEDGWSPANGWDGAPEWATLVDDELSRCTLSGIRETSPAVLRAWEAFWADEEGPDGVGSRTRYAQMWAHMSERFAGNPAVAGYDLMNEPGAFAPEAQESLVEMYSESLAEIRKAEAAAGADPTMVLFEPSAAWSTNGSGAPPQWNYDSNVVYSPHIYAGAFTGGEITRSSFETAVAEAKSFGGAPILTGEWGTAFDDAGGTQRTGPGGDGYFLLHQGWQDEFHISATIWEWHESCGDPHKVGFGDEIQVVAGIFEVDCRTNEVTGERPELIADLMWAYPRAAPGLDTTTFDQESGAYEIVGSEAEVGLDLVVFYPTAQTGEPDTQHSGLEAVDVIAAPGGSSFVTATVAEPDWTLSIT